MVFTSICRDKITDSYSITVATRLRQEVLFSYIEGSEQALFNDAQEVLLTSLQELADKIRRKLEDPLNELVEQVNIARQRDQPFS